VALAFALAVSENLRFARCEAAALLNAQEW
jgi:hypothetical protein